MKNKQMIFASAGVILVLIVSIAAITANPTGVKVEMTSTPNTGDVEKVQSSVETFREVYEQLARDYGIDPTGMTNEQLEAALLQNMPEIEVIKAQLIDVSGTNEDMKKEWDQLTTEERHSILQNNAREWGIDPTGMTDEQIEQAIAEKNLSLKQAGK